MQILKAMSNEWGWKKKVLSNKAFKLVKDYILWVHENFNFFFDNFIQLYNALIFTEKKDFTD